MPESIRAATWRLDVVQPQRLLLDVLYTRLNARIVAAIAGIPNRILLARHQRLLVRSPCAAWAFVWPY